MGRNWAIVVGINHYENLRSLKFAKRDASVMATWFEQEARFDQVFLFTDDSPPIAANPPIPTQPTFGHLRRFLRAQFENIQSPLLKPEDNLWFFFAGHGNRYKDKDYLMFSDSDPGDVENTAISVDFVTQRLRRSGADNVVLFLDACRDESSRAGLGIGEQRYQGVITFYSCTANQKSWEIEELEHGSFTHSLLEGLRLQGEANCATVERLAQYLRYQVPDVNTRYGKPAQNPYWQAEPPYKMYFILLEQTATLRDVEPLKYQASQAENKGDLSLAKQLWVRVLAVSRTDWDAIDAIGRIALRQGGSFELTITPDEPTSSSGNRSVSSEPTQESLFAQRQEEHRQNLVRYQQAFSEAIEREYPISRASRNKLKQLQQALQLKEEEVSLIEQPIIAPKEAEYRKQQDRIRQQQEAEKQRQQEEAARLKQREAETKRQPEEAEHRQYLARYQQAFLEVIEREYPFKESTSRNLKQLQKLLQLKEEEVLQIEQPIVAPKEAEYRKQQERIRHQEEAEKQRQQEEVARLKQREAETKRQPEEAEHRQYLARYQQAFLEVIEREYPFKESTSRNLKQLQKLLQLKEEEVLQIEQPIVAPKEAEYRKQQERIRHQEEAEKQRQQEEVARLKQREAETKRQPEEAEYRQKLQQYEQELIKTIDAGNSLDSDDRLRLNILKWTLGLKQTDITAIETRVVASQELIKSPIQQPSVAQPTQPTQERITRQKFLKWAGLGGVGLVTAVVGRREIFKGQSPTPISVAEPKYTLLATEKAFGLRLWNVEFETVTVDEKGQVIKRDSNNQAKLFKENLGNGVTLEMVSIPGGSFKMGSPSGEKSRNSDESPQHDVNVPAFFMGRFEVTQEQYQQVMGTNPSRFKGEKRPVEQVSCNDTVEFCKKLSQKTGRTYRLPSEAEWEYACRARTTTPFHFGETITSALANYRGDYTYASEPKGKFRQKTTEVGSFPPNAFGLYDMHGNVWEWCQDSWHYSYEGAPSNGSAWIDNDNQFRHLRGGSWIYDPRYCRSASRYVDRAERDKIGNDFGFRVVCAVWRILK